MTGIVNKIIPFSSVDGPGNRTAVFLQGCNFNCLYCHNPETIHLCTGCGECVSFCPTGALHAEQGEVVYDIQKCVFCDACFKHCTHGASARVRRMTPAQVMDEVARNQPFIRGVTVSGGECTTQRDFLLEFLRLAKSRGLSTLLDSNGGYDFAQDEALLAVTDGVMLDVKAWSPEEHRRVTGTDNKTVQSNLVFLARAGKLEEVRTVVVPGLFDTELTVRETCKAILPYKSVRSVRYKIIRYRPMGVRSQYQDLQTPSEEWLAHLEQAAHEEGICNTVII